MTIKHPQSSFIILLTTTLCCLVSQIHRVESFATITTTTTFRPTTTTIAKVSPSFRLFLATEDDNESPSPDDVDTPTTGTVEAADLSPPKVAVKCPDCDLCDGSGRITGGIGAILPWVPIKAYRPCPNFIDKGGRYTRSGQGLDEIAFGRGGSGPASSGDA